MKDKIAIIGFGASGYGTYMGLKEKGFKKIYIYQPKPLEKKIDVNHWSQVNLKKNYELLKNKLGFNTVNSKTFFGNNLESIISNNQKVYDNSIGGGLLNFWGGVLQKFDKETLKLCLNIENLDEYYQKISNIIPISQVTHKNSKKNFYANQENIKCDSYVEQLDEVINFESQEILKKDTLIATSQNINHQICNCFIGCLKHNIFKTTNLDKDNSTLFLNEEVKKIDFEKKKVITDNSSESFDKIYLNAGPYNDQKILISSMTNTKSSIKIKDSTSFTFPIFFTGKMKQNMPDFNLTNYIFSIRDQNLTLGHAQIYPPIDHINKSLFHHYFWDKLNFLKDISINRLLWARCYLNDEYSQLKIFNEDNPINMNFNSLKIKLAQKKFFNIFKKNLNNKNFYPIDFFINSKTSSHYSGDSYYIKNEILKQGDCHYKKNIFFNDSMLWKILPSESPTFTIMANALRNTDLYL
mgnify:FL=1